MLKTIITAILVLYLLVLLYLTLFRFPEPGAAPNLLPLKTIAHYLRAGGWQMVVNILGNLAAFMPLGLLLPLLRQEPTSTRRIALISLCLSLAIESLQHATGRRVADVDDVLLNTLGGLLGYYGYMGMGYLKRRMSNGQSRSPVLAGRDKRS